MGFIVKKAYTYSWPVEVKVPHESKAGQFDVQRFKANFKVEPAERSAERLKDLAENNPDEKDFTILLLKEVWTGWDEGEVTDADKKSVPATADTMHEMLQWPFVRKALLEGYTASISGQAAQARKAKN